MKKSRFSGLMGLAAAILTMISCSGRNVTPTPTPAETVGPEATEIPQIEITLALWGLQPASDEAGSASRRVYDEILDRFGIRIIPWQITWDDWKEQIETAAAEGSLPDFFAQDLRGDKLNLLLWSQEGLIRDIPESMWAEHPALYRVMKWVSGYGALPDGKMYYIPRTDMAFDQTGGQTIALYYRTDWARRMGYDIGGEISWERFIALLYDYVRGDPDGNGSVDTRGLTLSGEGLGLLYDVFLMDFGVRDWVLEDGKWIPGLMSDRAREALTWMNQLYRDGIIDPEYGSQTESEACVKFASGQAAMLAADGQRRGALSLRTGYWNTYNPNSDIGDHVALLPQPVNPYGVSYNELSVEKTGTLVSAGVDDEKLSRSLALFDWLYTEEGLTYMAYGVEGTDYEIGETGAVSLLTDSTGAPATFARLDVELSALSVLSTWNLEGLSPMEEQDAFDLACQRQLEDLWWINNWQRVLFTDAMYTPEIVTFDLREFAEGKLTYMMMMSTDINADWEVYLAECMSEYNTQAAIQEVNEYAREHNITAEE